MNVAQLKRALQDCLEPHVVGFDSIMPPLKFPSSANSGNGYWVLLLAEGVARAGGDGCFDAGCRTALGVVGGRDCLITGYVEVLSSGRGLIVMSTSGAGVDRLMRNRERMAMIGKTVKSRIIIIPSRVSRRLGS